MELTVSANHKQYLHTNGNRSRVIIFFIPETSHNVPAFKYKKLDIKLWRCDSIRCPVLQPTGHSPWSITWEELYRGAQQRRVSFASYIPEDIIRTNFRNIVILISSDDRQSPKYYEGFEVLRTVVMKSSVSWDAMPCSPLRVNRHFGGTCHLHLQGRSISQRWWRHVAPKPRLTSNELQAVISKKIELFKIILLNNVHITVNRR
jgi:hypothetical protein